MILVRLRGLGHVCIIYRIFIELENCSSEKGRAFALNFKILSSSAKMQDRKYAPHGRITAVDSQILA